MDGNERRILATTTVGHGSVHGTELAIPMFVPIWMAEFGVGAGIMGVVVALGYALFGIGALPGGVAADVVGSRRLIGLSMLGMGAAFVVVGLSPGIATLTGALILWGLAASVYHPAGLRVISTGIGRRGTAFGYHGIAGNIGIAGGPLIAALVMLAFDWRTAAMVLAVPAVAGGLYTLATTFEETAAVAGGDKRLDGVDRSALREVIVDSRALFTGAFLLVFPIVVLEGFFYRGVLTFLPDVLASAPILAPIELGEVTADPAQYVFVGILVVGMAGQWVGGVLSDRRSPERMLVCAFLALAILSVLFVPAMAAGVGALLVVSAALGFVLFGEQPILQTIIAEYSDAGVRGLSYGYAFLGIFGIGALGAAFSGAMLAVTTEGALFLTLGAVPAVAALGTIGLLWVSRRGGN